MRPTPSLLERAIQLNLFHPRPTNPTWIELPAEIRQQTMRLLVRMLRLHRLSLRGAAVAKELRDE